MKNESPVYDQIQISVAPREAVQKEMQREQYNFEQNPHENNHGLQRKSKNPSDDLRLWKYFRHR